MTARHKYLLFGTLALFICFVPPIATTLYYFPLWYQKGYDATVSGISVILLLICAIPLMRHIKEIFANPSAKVIWFVGMVLFWALESIINEMIIVCAVGFISNCIGSIMYKVRDRYKE